MFVINTDNNGNGGVISLSGKSDFLYDGDAYTMYSQYYCGNPYWGSSFCCAIYDPDTSAICNCNCNLQTTSTETECYCYTKTWDGCRPGALSVIDGNLSKFLDQDVLFPCNMICNANYGCTGAFSKNVRYSIEVSNSTSCSDSRGANFCFNPHLRYRVVSRKQFEAGKCVGKEVTGHLGMYFKEWGCMTTNSCYALADGIEFYVDMGLLHTDGTKTSILCKTAKTGYVDSNGCICGYGFFYYAGTRPCGNYHDCCGAVRPFFRVIHGTETTGGATTQEGDRLYIDFGNNGLSTCYCFHKGTATSGSSSMAMSPMTALRAGNQYKYGLNLNGYWDNGLSETVDYPYMNIESYSMNTYNCMANASDRNDGVRFSVE